MDDLSKKEVYLAGQYVGLIRALDLFKDLSEEIQDRIRDELLDEVWDGMSWASIEFARTRAVELKADKP